MDKRAADVIADYKIIVSMLFIRKAIMAKNTTSHGCKYKITSSLSADIG